ncbi:GlxA family transcriptional regulator [Marinitenerispora sediminis]|uniref:AraC family transcriptional regulator n=1 Tax=Marinitenerispora sediminis TaxID=1931232 RepID=A0A368T509_9ACTN|nr:helix-turn-helix domain-containing protein [Marinitenerispora sediminis]RCV54008.1 AraC family transcriptional regulator [Marinitenerispora sediminis]RCV57784.1 AraC family transcriptional regulator [Marinitenerispora sediminis]RCV59529.1 AraC family transcriptional regulator [Marinitenerispora sediminis]
MAGRRVVVVGYDGAELLEIASITTALDGANRLGVAVPYDVVVATPGGRAITCVSGLTLPGHQALERTIGPLDTVIVSGGFGSDDAAADPSITGHVRRLARESRRVASVCTGASVLAAAGLLDGRRATTHWMWAAELAARHPRVVVDPAPIYILDGKVATSAGVTSALDLTLAFIGDDHGARTARDVARALVTYLQRPGNQTQMSMFVESPPPGDRTVRRVVDHVTANLDGDLGAAALAAHAGVSERHLTRLFLRHLGEPPGRFVRRARTEAAAHLLVSTRLPLARVAVRCGFGSAETLRQAFVSRYGVAPSRYRAAQEAWERDGPGAAVTGRG